MALVGGALQIVAVIGIDQIGIAGDAAGVSRVLKGTSPIGIKADAAGGVAVFHIAVNFLGGIAVGTADNAARAVDGRADSPAVHRAGVVAVLNRTFPASVAFHPADDTAHTARALDGAGVHAALYQAGTVLADDTRRVAAGGARSGDGTVVHAVADNGVPVHRSDNTGCLRAHGDVAVIDTVFDHRALRRCLRIGSVCSRCDAAHIAGHLAVGVIHNADIDIGDNATDIAPHSMSNHAGIGRTGCTCAFRIISKIKCDRAFYGKVLDGRLLCKPKQTSEHRAVTLDTLVHGQAADGMARAVEGAAEARAIAAGRTDHAGVPIVAAQIDVVGQHAGDTVLAALVRLRAEPSQLLGVADLVNALHLLRLGLGGAVPGGDCCDGLPGQDGIAAVDAGGIFLKALAQGGSHRLQLLGGLGRGLARTLADALCGSSFQIIHIGELIRIAHGRAKRRAAGFPLCCRDLAGVIGIGQAGVLHNADQAAKHALPGGHVAGVIDILDGRLLGVGQHAADIGAAAGDLAGVVAAGHGAGVELLHQTAQIGRTGHIALVAAVGHIAVNEGAGHAAHIFGVANGFFDGHRHTGNHVGEIHILASAHNAADVAAIEGGGTGHIDPALHRQVLDGKAAVGCAGHPAHKAQIRTLAALDGISDGEVLDGMPVAVNAAGERLGISDGSPVDVLQVDVIDQLTGDPRFSAVDLLGKPYQLRVEADLVDAVHRRRLRGSLHRDLALCLHIAAGGSDGGGAGLQSGDLAVCNGGHGFLGRGPGHGLDRGILRLHRGGQRGGIALIQAQRRLVQHHGGCGNGIQYGDGALRLHIARRSGNGGRARLESGDLAVCNGGHRVIGGAPGQGVRGVLRLHRRRQLGGLGRAQRQRVLIHGHAGGGSDLPGQLDVQVIGRAGHDIHDAHVRDLAGISRGKGKALVLHQKLFQLGRRQAEGVGALFIDRAVVGIRHHQEGCVLHIDGHAAAVGRQGAIDQLGGVGRVGDLLNGAGRAVDGDRNGPGLLLDGDGALRLHTAAGGGDGGGTGLQGGDLTVFDGGHSLRRGGPGQGVRGVLRLHRGRQLGGLALGHGQLSLAQLYPGGHDGLLLKADRHIVIGEVGRLGEAVAVVAGAGHVEIHLHDLAQAGEIPLRPVHDDVLRAFAEIEIRRAGLLACGVITGGHQLDPVIIADLACQVVAVDVAV